MSRVRLVARLALVGGFIATAAFAGRALVTSFAGTRPVLISTEPAPVRFERAFPELILDRPIGLTFPPDGTNRIAVISQRGSLYLFPNDPSVEEPSEVLNIRDKVLFRDLEPEEGLLGLAFHPKFRDNRQFFLYYTTPDHSNVLARFTMSADDPNRADPESEVEIFRGAGQVDLEP